MSLLAVKKALDEYKAQPWDEWVEVKGHEVVVKQADLIYLIAVAEAAQVVAVSTGAGWAFTDALARLRDALAQLETEFKKGQS